MKFAKSTVARACNAAINNVRDRRDKQLNKEIDEILNGFFVRRIFRIKTREEAAKYIENSQDSIESCFPIGWRTEATAENLLRMCKYSAGDEMDLDYESAGFVSSWAE